jgi:hypothetical protein
MEAKSPKCSLGKLDITNDDPYKMRENFWLFTQGVEIGLWHTQGFPPAALDTAREEHVQSDSKGLNPTETQATEQEGIPTTLERQQTDPF